ncbi:hypothetical protein [Alsobacter sp. SYSU BS001988]
MNGPDAGGAHGRPAAERRAKPPGAARSGSRRGLALARFRAQAPVFALALTAIAFSALMVPRGRELALLALEAGDAAWARHSLESKFASGDRSPSTVAALAKARARTNDIAGAVSLLENLRIDLPSDPALLRTLGEYYRKMGRRAEYARIFEQLDKVQPTAETKRLLAQAYGELGWTDKEKEILQALIGGGLGAAGDFIALARIEGRAGRPLVGADLLERLAASYPAAVDGSVVAFEMRLRVSGGDFDRALSKGRDWVASGTRAPATFAMLAGALTSAGRPDLAAAFLREYDHDGAPEEIVLALIQAEIDAHRAAAALERLDRFEAEPGRKQSKAVTQLHLRLTLLQGELDRSMASAEAVGFETLPADVVAMMTEAALAAQRRDIVEQISRKAGNDFFLTDPVLAGQVALYLGDEAGARRWSDQALDSARGQPIRVVRLADLDLRLGRRGRALATIREELQSSFIEGTADRLAASGEAADATLLDFARLFIRLGAPQDGRAIMAQVRAKRPSDEADRAWALLAGAGGTPREAAAWLRQADPAQFTPGYLRELIFCAYAANAYELAGLAGRRLVQIRGTDSDRMLLAEIIATDNQPWTPLREAKQAGFRTALQPSRAGRQDGE